VSVKGFSGLMALCLTVAAPIAAQGPARGVQWSLKGMQAGFCVQFLVAPDQLVDELAGRIPTPIESLADRYPVLARVAAAESTYHGWIPAEYCWFLYRSAVVGGRTTDINDGRQPLMVGYLAVAASPLPDSATQVALGMFTNSTALERSMVSNRLQIDLIRYSVGVVPNEEEVPNLALYEAEHRGATIDWEGGPGAPRPPEPRAIRMMGFTVEQSLRGIRGDVTPDSAYVASGNLRVVGKGSLQKMLSGSPIRLLTSYLRGGDTELYLGQ
jgi:hypothetical protein